MKRCELCGGQACLQCDADQANLCWRCDAEVHSANFLVARHSRRLLCKSCQSTLPWSTVGGCLTPIDSVCEKCACGGADEDFEDETQVVPFSPPPPPQADSCSSSSGKVARDADAEDPPKKRHRIAKDLHSPVLFNFFPPKNLNENR